MMTKLWDPRHVIPRKSAWSLVHRMLIGLLVFGFVLEPVILHAQTGRKGKSSSRKDEAGQRRSARDVYSGASLGAEGVLSGETDLSLDVLSIGKDAYDAVIRSGRYIVGPSDAFLVVVDGDEGPEANLVAVGAEGMLVIPYVGAIPVAGLSLVQARKAINGAISRRFQHLDIEVSLARLRAFPVNVVGEVQFPGSYLVNGVEQASELIIRAGGLLKEPEGRASLRNIQVHRLADDGQPVTSGRRIDLQLWNITGDAAYNPYLLDGDQILVPARSDSTSISGDVQRPGNYEYAPGDRISDLVGLGGGLMGDPVGAKSELFRLPANGEDSHRVSVDLARALAGDPTADLLLRTGDKLFVEGREEWVTVEGEVRFSGAYPLKAGLTLKDLIEEAQLTSTASLAQASLIRQVQYGAQDDEDAVLTRLLGIPRAQLTDGERALLTLKTQEVPGRLPVDFVALFEKGDQSENILLKGGDIVRVPQFVSSVLVNGAVLAPAAIPYDSTYTVGDYIDRAGGFSDRAKKGDIIVVQGSTGHSIEARKEDRIAPGDAVYVPLKSPGQGWRIFRETLTVVTQIATLILIIQNTRK